MKAYIDNYFLLVSSLVLMIIILPIGSRAVNISIIPVPKSMKAQSGSFSLTPKTRIISEPGLGSEAKYLAKILQPATGYDLSISLKSFKATPSNSISLHLSGNSKEYGEEGYSLFVKGNKIEIIAANPAGIFYGIQSLRQLFPKEIFSSQKESKIKWVLPCVKITDSPRFSWRGQLFDCCRHYFDVPTVKRTIDLMALHKLNRLHWHLTEDQGWRVEIKQYPELTKVGAWRKEEDGSTYGGFYSQEEMKDIIAYGESRHVMIVPEIEMPGHSSAALASYPELGCTGGPYSVPSSWGVYKDVYCAGNESTFLFLENVLDEVGQIFPSPYIHIGGDECPKDRWKVCPKCQARIKENNLKDERELQSYFVKRIDTYLTSKGKHLIGWDEILEGGLSPNAMVQSWRGVEGGIEAAKQGHDVTMSPTSNCYLDYSYLSIPLEKAYAYEPIPADLPADLSHHILGLEGNIWTERVPTQDRLDFQVYPRMAALAEVGWSPKEKKNWNDFEKRMDVQLARYKVIGVKYGFDELKAQLEGSEVIGFWKPEFMNEKGSTFEIELKDAIKSPGEYSFFFLYSAGSTGVNIDGVSFLENGKEISSDNHRGFSGKNKRNIDFVLKLDDYSPGASYTIRAKITPPRGIDSTGEIRFKKTK